jgi:hypothetical protein
MTSPLEGVLTIFLTHSGQRIMSRQSFEDEDDGEDPGLRTILESLRDSGLTGDLDPSAVARIRSRQGATHSAPRQRMPNPRREWVSRLAFPSPSCSTDLLLQRSGHASRRRSAPEEEEETSREYDASLTGGTTPNTGSTPQQVVREVILPPSLSPCSIDSD